MEVGYLLIAAGGGFSGLSGRQSATREKMAIGYLTDGAPGIVLGLDPKTLRGGSVYTRYYEEDLREIARPGQNVQLRGGKGTVGELSKITANIASIWRGCWMAASYAFLSPEPAT